MPDLLKVFPSLRPASLASLHERLAARTIARIFASVAAAATLGVWGASAAPPAAPVESVESSIVTVRGEVVETACYVMADRKGEEHRQCGITCARAGQPLGILDEKTRTLLFLVLDRRGGEPRNPLIDLVANRVEVRGRRIARGGITGIVVDQVKDLGRRPRI
jgi:hypothetical protein